MRFLRVSAMLHLADPNDAADPNSKNRFTAMRQFGIDVCNQSACGSWGSGGELQVFSRGGTAA